MLLAALPGGWRLIAAARPQADAPLDERVAVIVKSEILSLAVPIASVAVMRDGRMLLDRAWGIADVERSRSRMGLWVSRLVPPNVRCSRKVKRRSS